MIYICTNIALMHCRIFITMHRQQSSYNNSENFDCEMETSPVIDNADVQSDDGSLILTDMSLIRTDWPYRKRVNDEEIENQMNGVSDNYLEVGNYVQYYHSIFQKTVTTIVTELEKSTNGSSLIISLKSGDVLRRDAYLKKLVCTFVSDKKWDIKGGVSFELKEVTAACMEED